MENFGGSLSIKEDFADLIDLILRNLCFTESLSEDHGWGDHLNDVSQRRLSSNRGQMSECRFFDFNVFCSAPDSYYLNNFLK